MPIETVPYMCLKLGSVNW